MEYPPFQLGKSRYDQSTFLGRLRHLLDLTDSRVLFTSEKRLNECIELLDAFKESRLPAGVTDKQLWDAQKIKQSIIHPDTGEKILMPFRMSGYVPFGTISVVGMLLPNPSIQQIVFWQWLNQSHNAAVNYSNRNASKPVPMDRLVKGYLGAVTCAVSVGVGFTQIIKSPRMAKIFKPTTASFIQKFVPFFAVATANVFNVLFMRNSEIETGIDVMDRDNNVVGTSKIAAKKAVYSTAMTRVALPAPLLIIPPLIMSGLEKTSFLKNNPRMHLPLNAVTCTICFAIALPVAIALFPQYAEVKTSTLEPEIQSATTEERLIFNKGL